MTLIMKNILSIDVGIENLALCLLKINKTNKTFTLPLWEIVNLSTEETKKCNKENCNHPLKYSIKDENIDKYYCLAHAKETKYILPQRNYKDIEKKSEVELNKLFEKYEEKNGSNKIQKKDLKNKKKEQLKKTKQELLLFFDTMMFKELPVVSVRETSLITIAKNLKNKLDVLFDNVIIDEVVIENQIGKFATKMMSIQGMLCQYFVMRHPTTTVNFISATNKLKLFQTKSTIKSEYADRKQKSIEICLNVLNKNQELIGGNQNQQNQKKNLKRKSTQPKKQTKQTKQNNITLFTFDGNSDETIQILQSYVKQDDMADSLLQGVYYISTKTDV